MAEIWAKSKGRDKPEEQPVTLSQHTNHLLQAFEHLESHLPEALVSKKLREAICLAILCHDFGKVLPAFQIRRMGNGEYEPFELHHDIDHSLVSVLWIAQEKIEEKIKAVAPNEVEDYKRFIISAVAYHHWRERFLSLLRPDSREFQNLAEKLLADQDFLRLLHENLISELRQVQGADSIVAFNREMAEGLKNCVPFTEYATPPYHLYWLPKRIGESEEKLKEYILISGFLMRCDHFASFCEKEDYEIRNIELKGHSPFEVRQRVIEFINRPESEIWQLKSLDSVQNTNVILVAPTGYGKTEFAFLWSNGQKLFYTLPIRSAVNQTYRRATSIFQHSEQNPKVGLLHGDSDVYLLGEGGESDDLRLYDVARQLSFPVMISTGDQFFPYASRPPGYEKIYATFSHSRLVIDEVQAYDPRAAAIVVKFLLDTVRMGGKFLLMTATLPNFVKEEVENGLKELNTDWKLIDVYSNEQEKFDEVKKHKVRLELITNSNQNGRPDFTLPDKQLDNILAEAEKGQRVLVIVNTVRQAINVYSSLKDKMQQRNRSNLGNKIWPLHSRFTIADRSDLETKICGDKEKNKTGEFENPKPDNEKIGKILVATQVVEASLDIDADVLFTEVAPFDALVQRMGRVLRRIKDTYEHKGEPNIIVWVFQNGLESGNGRVYERELLGITLKLFSMSFEGLIDTNQISNQVKSWYEGNNWKNLIVLAVSNDDDEVNENSKKKQKGSKKKRFEVMLPSKSILLSESSKQALVQSLYRSLDLKGRYLSRFYQTLDILNAGYMSDRKEEAHRMFREIFNVAIIPKKLMEKFKQDLLKFLEESKDQKHRYTRFKRDVLSKYVVNVPVGRGRHEAKDAQKLELWIREQPEFEAYRKQIISWTKNIWFDDYSYDKCKGIRSDEKRMEYDSAFL